jgi:hypothetical protein
MLFLVFDFEHMLKGMLLETLYDSDVLRISEQIRIKKSNEKHRRHRVQRPFFLRGPYGNLFQREMGNCRDDPTSVVSSIWSLGLAKRRINIWKHFKTLNPTIGPDCPSFTQCEVTGTLIIPCSDRTADQTPQWSALLVLPERRRAH